MKVKVPKKLKESANESAAGDGLDEDEEDEVPFEAEDEEEEEGNSPARNLEEADEELDEDDKSLKTEMTDSDREQPAENEDAKQKQEDKIYQKKVKMRVRKKIRETQFERKLEQLSLETATTYVEEAVEMLKEKRLPEIDFKNFIETTSKRMDFTMDEFVKQSQIRQVVNEALLTLVEKLQKTEHVARNNRKEITMLETQIKRLEKEMNFYKKLEQGQRNFMKHIRDHNKKIIDIQAYQSTTFQRVEDICNTLKDVQEENMAKTTKLEEQNKFQELVNLQIDNRITKEVSAWKLKHQKDRAEFEMKILKFDIDFKAMQPQIDQKTKYLDGLKDSLDRKMVQHAEKILNELRYDKQQLFSID